MESITQVCAFASPSWVSMSERAMLCQPSVKIHVYNTQHGRDMRLWCCSLCGYCIIAVIDVNHSVSEHEHGLLFRLLVLNQS